jgi:apolipoprotein N-acyltransferase
LVAAYAHGLWPLGFVALLPWLAVEPRGGSWRATLAWAWALCLAYVVGAFYWFGAAVGVYIQIGEAAGLGLMLLLAPLLQPQILAFALVRRALCERAPLWRALAAASAWLMVEWLLLKPLGDRFGHALQPARALRQLAELGGVAALTLMLLLVNQALLLAWQRRSAGLRQLGRPLVVAALLPALAAGFGSWHLLPKPSAETPPQLRLGLVQANYTALELRRRAQGSHAVVRELLDIHYAMSHDAIERQRADAVLWTETVYPTTFAQPKSEAGAELDREIVSIVNAAGVPFVFGTFDRDADGEYNAAAVVAPGQGLVGFYRKTHLFPLTEWVPAWMDGPVLRRWMPWLGSWRPGQGARVLPLTLRDGRELPMQVLICRDDMATLLAIEGARQGARALLTMSNDSWFSDYPQGARLHQMAAAFRSIETRLPQFRVTTNGHSALIDAQGELLANAAMNERSLVVGALPVGEPPLTLMVRWGDWLGALAALVLPLIAFAPWGWRRLQTLGRPAKPQDSGALRPGWLLPRWAAALLLSLRALAWAALLILGLRWGLDEGFRQQELSALRSFGLWVLAPEALAACVLAAYRVSVRREGGRLHVRRAAQSLTLDESKGRPWAWPLRTLMGPGVWLREGAWMDPGVGAGGAPVLQLRWPGLLALALALALPAFLLHQHIAFGGWLGEYRSFGAQAYAQALLIWWGRWLMAVALIAAALQTLAWLGAQLAAALAPARAGLATQALSRGGWAVLYLGLPLWLGWRIWVG